MSTRNVPILFEEEDDYAQPKNERPRCKGKSEKIAIVSRMEDNSQQTIHVASQSSLNSSTSTSNQQCSWEEESNGLVHIEDGSPQRRPLTAASMDLILAGTYIEEARYGRNGYFVPELKELRMYYLYNHGVVRLCLFLLITLHLSLILFEKPAVDGWEIPHWVIMLVETLCLCGYFLRLVHSWTFMPQERHWRDKKVLIVFTCVVLTLIDMSLYIVMQHTGYTKYAVRWSRLLRPAFMINFSESRQVRRAIRNIRRIIPEIMTVLILLFLVISLYALLGLKLFEKRNIADLQGNPFFSNYFDNFFSLYVLTTSANNPDVTIPAFNKDNWYSLFFVVYLVICMYIFMSIFLAVVYKNYRKQMKNEVKASVYRKRRNLSMAFDYLKVRVNGDWGVTFAKWKGLLQYMYPKMSPVHFSLMWQILDFQKKNYIEFKDFMYITDLLTVNFEEVKDRPHIFERMCPNAYNSTGSKLFRRCVQHRFFIYFFDLVIIANAICIGLDVEEGEIAFLVAFNFEIISKLYTLGPKAFFNRSWNIFDFVVIGGATIIFLIELAFEPVRYSEGTLDFLLVLRVLRLFKIVGNIKRFKLILDTVIQILPAILTYGAVMFVLYYIFAIIGMEFFGGKINEGFYPTNTTVLSPEQRSMLYCGNPLLKGSEFYRLQYCGKNFNNVLKSFSVLFDLTVVNQWQVLADGYVRVTSKFARLYFLAFHLTCVIVVLNIFVAFVLEAFMLQYSLSTNFFETALDKKITETGAKAGVDPIPLDGFPANSDENPLDENFSVAHYVRNTRVRYRLRPQRTKNAEMLLQRMFEDELDDEDIGPESNDIEHLDEAIELWEKESPKKLTLMNVDSC